MRTTETVLEHHLAAIDERNLTGVMEDYTDESVIVTPGETLTGLDEIETLFGNHLAEFSRDGTGIDIQQQTVVDDFAYVVWQAESAENVYEFATDTLYIPEDKIAFQTFAGKISPKN